MPNGRSSLVLAESDDGYDFTVANKPCLTPEDHKDCYEYVKWGIEDPRIIPIGDKYYLTYINIIKHVNLDGISSQTNSTSVAQDQEAILEATEGFIRHLVGSMIILPADMVSFYPVHQRKFNKNLGYQLLT